MRSVHVAAIALLALLCAHGATAQATAVTPIVAQAPACTTVAALASKSGVLGVLVSAAQAAGLVPELSDPTMMATVFAPSDDAFANLLQTTGLTSAQLLSDTTILTQILNNHIVPGTKLSTAQLRAQKAPLPTLLGESLQVKVSPTNDIQIVPLGGAPASILLGDLLACNAVVHIVDRVLLPILSTPLPVAAKRTDSAATATPAATSGESAASAAAASSPAAAPALAPAPELASPPVTAPPVNCTTIAALASGNPQLTTLVSAVQAAGLLATLSDPTLVATVFAPTNAAFALALASSGFTPAQLLANTTILAEILKNHVVVGEKLSSADLRVQAAPLTSLLGQNLQVSLLPPSTIQIIPTGGPAATVTTADLPACNAVVHVIDHVLLPKLSPPLPSAGSPPAPVGESSPATSASLSPSPAPVPINSPPPPPPVAVLPVVATPVQIVSPSPSPVIQPVAAVPAVAAPSTVPAYPYTYAGATGYAYAPWTVVAQQPADPNPPVAPGLTFTKPASSYTAGPVVLAPNPSPAATPAVIPYSYAPIQAAANPYAYTPAVSAPAYAYAPWTLVAQQPADPNPPVAPGLTFTKPASSYTAGPVVLTPNPSPAATPAVIPYSYAPVQAAANPYAYTPAVSAPAYTVVPQTSTTPAYQAPGLTFPAGNYLSKLFHYNPSASTVPNLYSVSPVPSPVPAYAPAMPALTFQAVPVPIAPVPLPAPSAVAAAAVGGRKMLQSAK